MCIALHLLLQKFNVFMFLIESLLLWCESVVETMRYVSLRLEDALNYNSNVGFAGFKIQERVVVGA